jgi:predicted RNA binding protein YcfA (HicA-like mRNA interferase family)
VIRALLKHGFVVHREGGNHTIVRDAAGRQISVPRHKELKRNTVRGMADDAAVPWPEFRKDVS